MKYTEVVSDVLKDIGLEYAYMAFPTDGAPALPYLLFYYPESNDFIADNTNYQSVSALNMELYTANKDFALEAQVEAVLQSYGLVYSKTESYLSSERMYEVLYEMQIVVT